MFSFLLLGGELSHLRWLDVRFGRECAIQFVTVSISKSKLNQSRKGVYHPLVASNGEACVVKALLKCAARCNWDPDSNELVFGRNILAMWDGPCSGLAP